MTKSLWGRGKDFPDTEPASTLPMLPPGEEAAYAETQPQPLVSIRPAGPSLDNLELAPLEVSLYEVSALARKDNRVCPQPTRWLEFYQLLKTHAAPGEPLPAEPLTGSAWAATPPLAKRMCFQEQLEWADRQHCLDAVHGFLKAMHPVDWYVV